MKRIISILLLALGMGAWNVTAAELKTYESAAFSISYPEKYFVEERAEQGMEVISFSPFATNGWNQSVCLFVINMNFPFLEGQSKEDVESMVQNTASSSLMSSKAEFVSATASELERKTYSDGHVGYDFNIKGKNKIGTTQYVYTHVTGKDSHLYQVAVIAKDEKTLQMLKSCVETFSINGKRAKTAAKADAKPLQLSGAKCALSNALKPLEKTFEWNELSFRYPENVSMTHEEGEEYAELKVICNGIGGVNVLNINCTQYIDLSTISREEWENSTFPESLQEAKKTMEANYMEITWGEETTDSSKPFPNYNVPFSGTFMGHQVKGKIEYQVMDNFFICTITQCGGTGWRALFERMKRSIIVR